MRVRIQHVTRYAYDGPATFGPHVVRLRPAEHTRARLLTYNLAIEPGCEMRWQHDPWGNRVARLTFSEGTHAPQLSLQVDAALDIRPVNPFDFFVDDRCKQLPFAYPDGFQAELEPFLRHEAPGPRLRTWLEKTPLAGYVVDWLVALNQRVASDVLYIIRNESGIQTSEQTLEAGRGSCRDSALLLVDALRARGLAARFVSGYLVQLADEGIIPDLAKGVARDVLDLHAWAEVFVPGGGWIGLDGTSGLLCGEGHIPLACTVNPELAAPVSGTTDRPAASFTFDMKVERLGHEPRPRRPYTDEQWAALRAAGDVVDARLRDAGLRLTMGGEPTWTSREHPRAAEWNTEALGATKWDQALRMAREVSGRLGTGTLLMHRMGKQYPGESLPRWALHLLWRKDGEPVWRDPELLDTESARTGFTLDRMLEDAQTFGAGLARRLSVPQNLIAGYEDPWRFLVDEANLPPDLDPLSADLDDPEERRRLARVLARGLGRIVGYALPLARRHGEWTTSPWQLRRKHLFLVAGDSPMGLRLPLGSIGGAPFESYPRDPSTIEGPLGLVGRPLAERRSTSPADAVPGQVPQPSGIVRTALCLEPRDGVLHLFLPPFPISEDFLGLVRAIEETAAETGIPIRVEGYGPPPDPRIQSCLLTPDPGVLEVNVPVTESFGDYVRLIEQLHDAANHAGLSTEKYQLDGREVGSGGGNHITLGGPTPLESPFLRKPRLLGSLLRYLQHHPSLSFLFTGQFVGPTSQAPRIDEARHDALYELEIALRRLPPDEAPFPWLVDRMLRNLLVDVTGSTHRTEVCIDKLYDPGNVAGRQGIVELRAFEMPPHERMAAAQMLLARSLIARFARRPYEGDLVRWGSQLHDRFMLPHYLWEDFRDVARDLARNGFPLDEEWYRPFLDYRFPVMGTIEADNVHLEVRSALEPWPVLGEEPEGSLVARYVDSSLERVQVRVDGMIEGRHVVLVNGHVLPLRPTGRASERVAGVRFRAWQPPHCLQPHIGIHHPLQIDIVDTWGERSLGACTYHVWHPDGRGYDQPPLTAFEAAARRAQRFTTGGHLPHPVEPQPAAVHQDQPYTLDLRRFGGDRPQPR